MMNPESKRPVTVEDLLRLKRAERPRAEFWTEFDRELRAKQLAALVEKRPWWRALPRALGGMARYHLPLGATAVLAISLLSIRDHEPVLPDESAQAVRDAAVAVADSEFGAVAAALDESMADSLASTITATTASATGVTAPEPGELARIVPLLPEADKPSERAEMRPSARSIAENRAVAEAFLGATPANFELQTQPARIAPQEPLAQMTNPAETRRSRFAMAFASAVVETSTAPSARVARRLSDEELYDSIHRFGAKGNSVSFRF